jgi:hypothetical protein
VCIEPDEDDEDEDEDDEDDIADPGRRREALRPKRRLCELHPKQFYYHARVPGEDGPAAQP